MVIALVVLAVISTPGRRLRQAVWAQALMLAPQIVVLDPGGHGGIDTGAAGQTRGGDRKRDHFARVSVSEGVSKSERGGRVLLTRSDDKELSEDFEQDCAQGRFSAAKSGYFVSKYPREQLSGTG